MVERILIVEDEPAIADTLSYALRTEGFHPECCDQGLLALECVKTRPPALMVLDVGLPDLSGFEVCRRVRKISELPILFLTARGDEVDRIVGLELGADDYVTKPFSPREVAARVRTILKRTRHGSTFPAPQAFELDFSRRTVTWKGRALDLTRYEFDLLRTLLSHPGRVYTRSELMESIWAGAEETLDRTVDTHIKTLRAKLRAVDPDFDPIQTHRGLGYAVLLP